MIHALRALALLLVVVAIWDPAITTNRRARPVVSLIATTTSQNSQLGERVANRLTRDFTVVRSELPGASAVVVVGDRLPNTNIEASSPAFAVVPSASGSRVSISAVNAPKRAQVQSKVPIAASLRITGASNRKLEVTLRWGDLVIDRVEQELVRNDERVETTFSFVPTSVRSEMLRVEARVAGSDHAAAVDLAIDIRDTRWTVLFFDRRPSWMSTFVRRALEGDPRFVVTNRVVTSRNISSSAGQPPDALSDATLLDAFDVIVTGSAESLLDRDVPGLESFMRKRGGGAVLLLDQTANGPYSRLTDVSRWSSNEGSDVFTVRANDRDSSSLQMSEVAWPATMPLGAVPVALTVAGSDSVPARPVLWQTPVGAGRLLVSGALDSWRFRENEVDAFEKFWRNVIAESAEAAVPEVHTELENHILQPGGSTRVTVAVRDAALQQLSRGNSVSTSVQATLESPNGAAPIRLWPSPRHGYLEGELRAPATAGSYRVSVSANGIRSDATLNVADTVSRSAPDERDVLNAFVASTGGKAFSENEVGELVPALKRLLQPEWREERWRPMRSIWWIIPFAMLLGGEWWMRRRKGLR